MCVCVCERREREMRERERERERERGGKSGPPGPPHLLRSGSEYAPVSQPASRCCELTSAACSLAWQWSSPASCAKLLSLADKANGGWMDSPVGYLPNCDDLLPNYRWPPVGPAGYHTCLPLLWCCSAVSCPVLSCLPCLCTRLAVRFQSM